MNQSERAELVADIAAAIKASSTLSEDEVRWVKLAIEKQPLSADKGHSKPIAVSNRLDGYPQGRT